MPQILFIEPGGDRREVTATPGESLMQAATRHGVAGILAECGGSCMCATCHCYVEAGPASELPEPEAAERETLEFVALNVRPESRLSCQIQATTALDGLVLRVAPR